MNDETGIERLVRPDIAKAAAYVPIRPLEVLCQISGKRPDQIVKLDGNENPYGTSPRARKALADYHLYHIYPDPQQEELRQALQGYTGLGEEHILAGAGSDELIDLLLRLLLDPGDEVIDCPPTFGMYSFSTGVCAGRLVKVPRDDAFAVDAEAVKKAVTRRTKVIFIASPNNPSGNVTPEPVIQELLELGILVVVDEAYYEFSGLTVVPTVLAHSNLVVLRTFSKWAGLAGLRVGYGLFPPGLLAQLMKIKQPYNINAAAMVAAQASLADLDYLRGNIGRIVRERERLMGKLAGISFLSPYPSQANFILCRVAGGRARDIHLALQHKGIFLRYFDSPGLRDCIRVSVGTPEHTDVLVQALKEVA